MTQRTASPKEIYRILSTYPPRMVSFPVFLLLGLWVPSNQLPQDLPLYSFSLSHHSRTSHPNLSILIWLEYWKVQVLGNFLSLQTHKIRGLVFFFFKLKSKWNQVEVGFSSNWRNRLQGTSWITSYMSLLLVASAQLVWLFHHFFPLPWSLLALGRRRVS